MLLTCGERRLQIPLGVPRILQVVVWERPRRYTVELAQLFLEREATCWLLLRNRICRR